MPRYKTLEKNRIPDILRKESIFLYSKRNIFIGHIGVFTSLGVAISRVTFCDRAQILNLFSLHLHGSNVKSEKNVTLKDISSQSKLNKKITYLEEK